MCFDFLTVTAAQLQDVTQFHKLQFLALQSVAFMVLCSLQEGEIRKAHSVHYVAAITYKGIVLVTVTLVPPVRHTRIDCAVSYCVRTFQKAGSETPMVTWLKWAHRWRLTAKQGYTLTINGCVSDIGTL